MNVGIVTLGLSPAVVSEFTMALRERGKELKKLLLLTTEGSAISFHALRIAFAWSNTPPPELQSLRIEDMTGIDLVEQRLGKEDITSLEDCKEFRHNIQRVLKNALKWAQDNPQNIYVCVAGGRKTMPIDAYLVSLANKIPNIFHLVAPDLPGVSSLAAMRREEREKKGREWGKIAENPRSAPQDVVREVLQYSFPPKNLRFELVKLPYIEVPEGIKKEIVG